LNGAVYDAVDFFQNGGAGWKHARRSDCDGQIADGLVNIISIAHRCRLEAGALGKMRTIK